MYISVEDQINKQAESFIELNKTESKHLDYSINSLDYIEALIEKRSATLINSFSCIEQISSYMLKTFLNSFNYGRIIKQDQKHPVFFNEFSGEKIDTFNYVYQRILEKNNNRLYSSL